MKNELISILFGWISLILFVSLLLMWFRGQHHRIPVFMKSEVFHKISGIVILLTTLIHGKTIVNKEGLATGIISFLLLLLLAGLYFLKDRLGCVWLKIHRYLSLLLVVVVVIHLMIGIIVT